MSRDEQRLLRHLAAIVLVKLVLLGGLWWLFVCDAGVQVDAGQMAVQVGSARSH